MGPDRMREATAWLDERLAAASMERTGAVELSRVRPWATLLRAPTDRGAVWLKAAGRGTAFEIGLYGVLADLVPERVLAPIGLDRARGWLLLPDGGPTLGDRLEGAALTRALGDALVRYAELQRAVAPHVDALLDAGVPDMRPAVMPQRYEEALEAAAATARTAHDRAVLARLAALRPAVAGWCEQLARSPLPPSLDHNDLHPFNVLGGADGTAGVRFYDWGDSVVAHPLAVLLVPLDLVDETARDAYLAAFTDLAPLAELRATVAPALRVATIARALTWERGLRAARDHDAPIDPSWAAGPFDTLAALVRED